MRLEGGCVGGRLGGFGVLVMRVEVKCGRVVEGREEMIVLGVKGFDAADSGRSELGVLEGGCVVKGRSDGRL
jgi:hypothetical protein